MNNVFYVIISTILFMLWIPFVGMAIKLSRQEIKNKKEKIVSKIIILTLSLVTIFMLSHFIWAINILF